MKERNEPIAKSEDPQGLWRALRSTVQAATVRSAFMGFSPPVKPELRFLFPLRVDTHMPEAWRHGLARWYGQATLWALTHRLGAAHLQHLLPEAEPAWPRLQQRARQFLAFAPSGLQAKLEWRRLRSCLGASCSDPLQVLRWSEQAWRLVPSTNNRLLHAYALCEMGDTGGACERVGALLKRKVGAPLRSRIQFAWAYFLLHQGKYSAASQASAEAALLDPESCLAGAQWLLSALQVGDAEQIGQAAQNMERLAWPGDPDWNFVSKVWAAEMAHSFPLVPGACAALEENSWGLPPAALQLASAFGGHA